MAFVMEDRMWRMLVLVFAVVFFLLPIFPPQTHTLFGAAKFSAYAIAGMGAIAILIVSVYSKTQAERKAAYSVGLLIVGCSFAVLAGQEFAAGNLSAFRSNGLVSCLALAAAPVRYGAQATKMRSFLVALWGLSTPVTLMFVTALVLLNRYWWAALVLFVGGLVQHFWRPYKSSEPPSHNRAGMPTALTRFP